MAVSGPTASNEGISPTDLMPRGPWGITLWYVVSSSSDILASRRIACVCNFFREIMGKFEYAFEADDEGRLECCTFTMERKPDAFQFRYRECMTQITKLCFDLAEETIPSVSWGYQNEQWKEIVSTMAKAGLVQRAEVTARNIREDLRESQEASMRSHIVMKRAEQILCDSPISNWVAQIPVGGGADSYRDKVWYEIAISRAKKQQFDRAKKCAEKISAQSSWKAKAWSKIGKEQFRAKRLTDAESTFAHVEKCIGVLGEGERAIEVMLAFAKDLLEIEKKRKARQATLFARECALKLKQVEPYLGNRRLLEIALFQEEARWSHEAERTFQQVEEDVPAKRTFALAQAKNRGAEEARRIYSEEKEKVGALKNQKLQDVALQQICESEVLSGFFADARTTTDPIQDNRVKVMVLLFIARHQLLQEDQLQETLDLARAAALEESSLLCEIAIVLAEARRFEDAAGMITGIEEGSNLTRSHKIHALAFLSRCEAEAGMIDRAAARIMEMKEIDDRMQELTHEELEEWIEPKKALALAQIACGQGVEAFCTVNSISYADVRVDALLEIATMDATISPNFHFGAKVVVMEENSSISVRIEEKAVSISEPFEGEVLSASEEMNE